MPWTLLALTAVTLLAWLFLLYRLLRLLTLASWRKRREEVEARKREQAEKAAREAEEKRKRKEAEQDRQNASIKAVLSAHPLLAQALMKLAGQKGEAPVTDSPEDKARVEEIARRVPVHLLQLLIVAGTQKDIEFDLQTNVVREKAPYPTNDVEPVPMSSIDQVGEILPEQLMQEDDSFYGALANQELLVLQPYERQVEKKTLFILLDLSNSMTGEMSNGVMRHSWSRGITLNLLLRAVRGEATYLLRGFAGHPYSLQEAANPEEAARLIKTILGTPADGNNTWIYGAVQRAAEDIRERKARHEIADLLLITDGEDQSMDDTVRVKRLLGEDIRLHVASIGKRSPSLQRAATTYQVFL